MKRGVPSRMAVSPTAAAASVLEEVGVGAELEEQEGAVHRQEHLQGPRGASRAWFSHPICGSASERSIGRSTNTLTLARP